MLNMQGDNLKYEKNLGSVQVHAIEFSKVKPQKIDSKQREVMHKKILKNTAE